jgi:hypothetical protein
MTFPVLERYDGQVREEPRRKDVPSRSTIETDSNTPRARVTTAATPSNPTVKANHARATMIAKD